MPTPKELDDVYMGTAILHSKLSKAKRATVGAVLVTTHGVCLTGYNGTPRGMDNNCEEIDPTQFLNPAILKTKPEVIHAELNCILKAAKEGVQCENSTVYVTLSPCVPCAAMLVNVGIKRLVYKDLYRDDSGVKLLEKAGILVSQYETST